MHASKGPLPPGSDLHTIEALKLAGEIDESDLLVRIELVMHAARTRRAAQAGFGFPVAFAVLRPGLGDRYKPRYFRVADHLQRMGFGFRAVFALVEQFRDIELDLATRAPLSRAALADSDRTRFVRLFLAAKRIRDRC